MRSLYFTKPCRPYNAGELAGFPDEVANRLIASGVAIPVEQRGKKVEEKPMRKVVRKPAKRVVKKK